ncbi:FecR family protein [Winogradskyella forsetii]|uniref:FecR family protein n=1 Tax=Winogradskyella forsetii TaxID=2686077 RepID=UPI0015C03BDC|nr:FecR domain-containing protein [Winogradskyella forsetii]
MKDNQPNDINFNQISTEEKSRLKRKIENSVFAYAQKKRRRKYAIGFAAASIILLFSVGLLFDYSKQDVSPIETFVNASKDVIKTEEVKLILGDAKNIEITEENSAITYSDNGQNVSIGNSKLVNQNVGTSKDVVFNTLIVPYGKRSEIVLADGSKVWLNSGTKLIFPATFLEGNREVYLDGEAIFEVKHNKNQPFIVKSKDQDIEVLGTVFNVSNYKDDDAVLTVLKSGSIKLHYTIDNFMSSQSELKIAPNTLATYHKKAKQIKTKTVEVETYFSWRDGVFIFRNDPLKTIMKKLSRYYDVEITINDNDLANQSFSGYLDVSQDLEHVMQIIKEAESAQFDYKLTSNKKLIIN